MARQNCGNRRGPGPVRLAKLETEVMPTNSPESDNLSDSGHLRPTEYRVRHSGAHRLPVPEQLT